MKQLESYNVTLGRSNTEIEAPEALQEMAAPESVNESEQYN
jgi:hypothetical protein